MRFGISATSRMDPKNLRTLLRPVNGWFMVTPRQIFRKTIVRKAALPARWRATRRSGQRFWFYARSSASHGRRRPWGRRPPFFFASHVRPRTPVHALPQQRLLDLDLGAGTLELRLDLLRLVLGDGFLDGLRRRLDEILRLLQAERGDRAHFLDDVDLVGA